MVGIVIAAIAGAGYVSTKDDSGAMARSRTSSERVVASDLRLDDHPSARLAQPNPAATFVRGGDARRTAASGTNQRVTRPRCESAHRAVAFYSSRVNYWLDQMGAATVKRFHPLSPRRCPRYLANVLQTKAYALRREYARWIEYHYHWWKWMPDKWQRIGRCETGYGQRPGNFHWDSGTYVSFAGIIRDGYATFARRLGLPTWDSHSGDPTPRQQLLVAMALEDEYGFGAWGCGGA